MDAEEEEEVSMHVNMHTLDYQRNSHVYIFFVLGFLGTMPITLYYIILCKLFFIFKHLMQLLTNIANTDSTFSQLVDTNALKFNPEA